MSLTSKQERFAQAVVGGMSQAEAYRTAFNVRPTTKAESVAQNASRLMGNVNVASRVDELREKLVQRSLWSREMSVKALVRAYKIAEDGSNASGMTGAVKELNAMHGFNEPIKLEHNGAVQHSLQISFK